jgi:hypothetical protein
MARQGCDITTTTGPDAWPLCGWEYEDGSVCGRYADAVRAWADGDQWRRAYYCPIHIRALRRRTDDDEALRLYGTATYPVSA